MRGVADSDCGAAVSGSIGHITSTGRGQTDRGDVVHPLTFFDVVFQVSADAEVVRAVECNPVVQRTSRAKIGAAGVLLPAAELLWVAEAESDLVAVAPATFVGVRGDLLVYTGSEL